MNFDEHEFVNVNELFEYVRLVNPVVDIFWKTNDIGNDNRNGSGYTVCARAHLPC